VSGHALALARIADSVAQIEAIRSEPGRQAELVELLREQSPLYRGLATREAERLRGYVLASFEWTGTPAEALPFIEEELTTGMNAYALAAAARALRGLDEVSQNLLVALQAAVARVAGDNDYVQYASFDPADRLAPKQTALADMIQSVAALGPKAAALKPILGELIARGDALEPGALAAAKEAYLLLPDAAGPSACCHKRPTNARPAGKPRDPSALDHLEVQDQGGSTLTFGELRGARPTALTFFYTRCMNPQKCSLTISKLAKLQRLLDSSALSKRVNVIAFTYDPEFDNPERLHAYGYARTFAYDDRNRLVRTTGPIDRLAEYFDLGVGYGPATVNRHRIELLVLDAKGHVAEAFTRSLWSEEEVVRALAAAFDRSRPDDPSTVHIRPEQPAAHHCCGAEFAGKGRN
jgi:protein SCO1/2